MIEKDKGPIHPTFCGSCGAVAHGSTFCQSCGARLVNEAGSFTEHQDTPPAGIPAQAATSAEPRSPAEASVLFKERLRRRRLIGIGAGIGIALLLVVIVAGVLVATSSSGPSFSQQAGSALAPLVASNARLVNDVANLKPGGDTAAVVTDLSSTKETAQSVQIQVDALPAAKSNTSMVAQIDSSIGAEMDWLKPASAVLSNTGSPQASQLSGLGSEAKSRLDVLKASIPALKLIVFPSSDTIVAFASAATASSLTNLANAQFSNQVVALLNQSTGTFQQVNTFFGQLQDVANGGYSDLTLPVAEQQISSIVASRTSLAAAAQALNAPTPAAQNVASLLVQAFNASLQDDNAIDTCLNEANDGTVAYIYQSCLSSSTASSSQATSDKTKFLDAFNQLRSTVGQPPINIQF